VSWSDKRKAAVGPIAGETGKADCPPQYTCQVQAGRGAGAARRARHRYPSRLRARPITNTISNQTPRRAAVASEMGQNRPPAPFREHWQIGVDFSQNCHRDVPKSPGRRGPPRHDGAGRGERQWHGVFRLRRFQQQSQRNRHADAGAPGTMPAAGGAGIEGAAITCRAAPGPMPVVRSATTHCRRGHRGQRLHDQARNPGAAFRGSTCLSRSRSLYRSPGTPIGKSIDYLDFATIKLAAPAYGR
jgi:hypothetical protein